MFHNKEVIDYEFECTSLNDYKLTLTFKANDNLMMKIFEATKEKYKSLKDNQFKDVKEFYADVRYHNYIRTSISKQIKDCFKLIEKDKIFVLNNKVKSAKFSKKNNFWTIDIILEGQYVDKRLSK